MPLGDKSVAKQLKKLAQDATKTTLDLNSRLKLNLEKFAEVDPKYVAARKNYENMLRSFGVDKFNKIAEKKLQPVGGEMAEIEKIIKSSDAIYEIGEVWGVLGSVISDLKAKLERALASEKAAWDKVSKYLADKEANKALGDDVYKKWKKELRAELFPK